MSTTTATTTTSKLLPTFTIINLALALTLTSTLSLVITATAQINKTCNFERYALGCYSQANFQCDTETNTCRCISGTVLVDRLCWKRVKANEVCQYSDQCDTNNNYRCRALLPVGSSRTSVECSPQAVSQQQLKCRCSIMGHEEDGQVLPDSMYTSDPFPQAREEPLQPRSPHNSLAKNSHSSPGSILSRIVWISLIFILIGLITLLLLIKYQSFRTSDRPFHRTDDDRLSINSEPDVPPPYEVAIRMKD